MGTCPSKPGKLNGSNVDNFVMANKGTNALPQTNVKYNKNLKVVTTSAEPTNKNVKYNKNLKIVDSQPKGNDNSTPVNDNPKPVEKEEKEEKVEKVQNGPTMVGGKRKHRKTQRKSKKRSSSRK